ncbi:hypothetical protein F4678DRAFT_216980 [Xylaria arbuscula]|nr:hypothetical protein F4678DRAFT_216980 [Xylaria arbuscula]
MKFQLSAALLGLGATAVSAQYNQTGPFVLHIKGTAHNSKINGYGSSCHAGAAIEGLCYSAKTNTTDLSNEYYQYYFNYTTYNQVNDDNVGILVWNLPYSDGEGNTEYESQSMGLVYQPNSNVAAPQFGFSNYEFNGGFDKKGLFFGYNYIDDSKFVAGQEPADVPTAYYQWYVCWQYFTGYFYQSVAWVQTGAPHNPTCESVEIIKVAV